MGRNETLGMAYPKDAALLRFHAVMLSYWAEVIIPPLSGPGKVFAFMLPSEGTVYIYTT